MDKKPTKMKPKFLLILSGFFFLQISGCRNSPVESIAEQWKETELEFLSSLDYPNPYTDLEFWVEFTHESGKKLVRPGFWDGGQTWKVRFASPADTGEWRWQSFSSNENDSGLHGKTGVLAAKPYSGTNTLVSKGLLRMSPGKRNVIHADGSSFLMIGDTPWALPWRGTL